MKSNILEIDITNDNIEKVIKKTKTITRKYFTRRWKYYYS